MAEPRFSLLRAQRSQLKHLPGAPEVKIGDDLAARSDVVARGILVPSDALDPVQRRDLTTDFFNNGGALVSEGTLSGEPQPALRPARWSVAAGVQEIAGLEDAAKSHFPSTRA